MRVFGQEGRGQERAVAVAGVISGTVFQDYNYNGKRDTGATLTNNGQGTVGTAVDTGVAGVTVTAFDPSNIAVGTATSGADGSYSLNALGNGPYRIEFTNLPTGYFPAPVGDNTQSNVRFVSGVSAGNIDFGVVVPSTYCQDNPTLVTSCYVGGPQTSGNPVVVSFPYSAGSTRMSGGPPFSDFDAPAHANLTTDRQVGTLWGVAYARGAKTLYFSSFMKKHAGFGPSGPGAIYTINPANGSPSLFFNAGAAVGANPHDLNDFDRDNGNVAWDAVGKVAFGGVALNGPETRLYAMNLAERALYEFPTDVPPTAVNIRKQAVPATLPGCPSADDVRPFAVHWNEGRLYVGLTCTAESTVTGAAPDGDASKLAAYVYTVDPATLAFSAQPVFQAALNYPRGCADSAQLGQGACVPAAWRAWSKVFRTIGTDQRGIYPQPWLTDIAFDRGNLILGLRDRSGDQFGNFTLEDPRSSTRIYGVSAGDTLRASGNLANGWTLESNGRSGGNGTGPQNNGQGPGGAEFYFQDFYVPFNDENGIGGLLQVPGFPDVVVNSADPIPIFDNETLFDGGTLWHNNTSGARSKTYRVFDGTTALDIFGKANGLGDLVALCDPAPLEIGNRIWRDTNGNGIQDADEAGLAGVKVELYKNGIKVGETTTSASGTYYFNNANVPGGVLPQMNYEIRIDKTQAALVGLSLTKPDADSGDIRDSDATMVGNNAVISVTTGTAGQNNHDYDAGFLAQPTIVCPPNQTVCATAGGNTATVNYPGPTATNANSVSCNPAAGSSFPVGTTTVTCTATNTAGSVSCSFTVTVNPQPTITCGADITAVAASAGGTAVTYPAPTANNATSVMCSPASGSNFPVGMTTVTCNAANDCGTATCSFKVTVTAPPTIVCPPNQTVCATTSAGCQTFAVPALTHGFTTNAQLPQGDHFLLPQPFSFTVPQSTPGLNIFQVNPANFGGSISGVGGFDGTAPQGVSYATPNGRFTALSCTDSIWDFSFVVASTGATVGDTVTFFTQGASGSPSFNIVTLTVEAGGVRVTALNALVTLNLNSRLATSGKLAVGDLIPSAAAAGSAGSRTGLLTLSYLMQAGSPLDACLQLGMSINRGAGAGAVALLVTDVIVRRNEVAGDRARTQTGLLGGLTGGYPTGLVCPLVCPPCQVQGSGAVVNYPAPTTTNATGVVCNPPSGSSFPLGVTTVTCTASNAAGNASCSFTVTVKSPPTITCPADITATAPGATGMTITYPAPTATNATTVTCTPASGTNFPVGMTTVTCTATNDCGTVTCSFKVTVNQPVKCDTLCYRAPQWWLLNLDRMPGGNVLIAGVNGNQSVNTSQRRTIELALRGNPFGFALTPRQALNQEYVAAQLNVMSAGGNGSAVVANSMWTNLSCYGIDIPTTTLSNGAVITSGSMVKELYMQITLAIQERREVDFLPLARLLDLLNGNDPRGFCN
ncbi:MAG: HYR domain-containing protein [Acidobacteria bacterium]|nr:HYR domain-containing protein [Acidobacteriota bacterium]